ncbi:MAG: translation initiation factor IF-2 [Thermodesulfobacteriota bacterium]|nr:translation initiation factor IF-2 [Thermodesulfobacteriota bacterium]
MRVYELAHELGMTSSDLISKLRDMDITVKGHQSSINDEEVQGIKDRISAAKTQEIVEKRIKPTIIRRRKKKIQKEVKPVEVEAKATEPPQDKEPISDVSEKDKIAPEVEKKKGPVVEREAKPELKAPEPVVEIPVTEKKEEPSKEPVKKKPHEEIKKPKSAQEVVKKEEKTEVYQRPAKKKVVYKRRDVDFRRVSDEVENLKVEPKRGKNRRKPLPKPTPQIEKKTEITIPKAVKRKIKILDTITVGELAKRMGIKANEVIRKLLDFGTMATINQPLDFDTASLIAGEFSYAIESTSIEEEILERKEDAPEELVHRPPVVTVMGHVDHGKTSLLDAIRETNVIGKEAGGITQHIGAYHVSLPKGDIVFLDTPGHEAFTSMRARGANVTDIVVLVVAADDGVMSQTVEAINHARAADVTLMVAVNKIDKPNAVPEKVKRDLMEYELVSEELGGDTIFVEVSAKQRQGINDLLELVLLQAEILELKANPKKPARGVVIEAKLDKGIGPVATVLVQEGTLKVGDPFVVGVHFGRIRALINEWGERETEVGPSQPIEVIGLSGVPEAGNSFIVVEDEKKARQVAMLRQQKKRESELAKAKKITLEELYDKMQEEEIKELKVILKADVQGSIEALMKALEELSTDSINVNIIHTSVGGILESDVMLASASDAIIVAFNVKSDLKVQQIAEKEKVSIRFYSVIYEVISDVKKAMEGLLEPKYEEKILGRAQVRDTFNISKIGTIAGSYVLDGKIVRGENARLLRDNVVIHEGKIISLKRFKDDVKEVQSGYECGIGIGNFNDVKVEDVIESYTYEEVLPTL